MQTKLILVEGLPGSGKSTTAKNIAAWLKAQNPDTPVRLYGEGDLHPADLAWLALVPAGEYDDLLARYPAIADAIRQNTAMEGEWAIVAYTLVHTDDHAFYEEMGPLEIYNRSLSAEAFCEAHCARWRRFGDKAQNKDAVTIFECAFLQNHVNELYFIYQQDEADIAAHLRRLLAPVQALNPVLLYLSTPDVRETLVRAGKQRENPEGNWLDGVIAYVENSPRGKAMGRNGMAGLVATMEERKTLELSLLQNLPLESAVIDVPAFDWQAAQKQAESWLAGQ